MPIKESIAIVATCDTKGEEAAFLKGRVETYDARALVIDTGVLGDPVKVKPDISKHEVAGEAGYTIEELIAFGTRGDAVERMREGLNRLVTRLHQEGRIHGLIAIGGAEGAFWAGRQWMLYPLEFRNWRYPPLLRDGIYSATSSATMMPWPCIR